MFIEMKMKEIEEALKNKEIEKANDIIKDIEGNASTEQRYKMNEKVGDYYYNNV